MLDLQPQLQPQQPQPRPITREDRVRVCQLIFRHAWALEQATQKDASETQVKKRVTEWEASALVASRGNRHRYGLSVRHYRILLESNLKHAQSEPSTDTQEFNIHRDIQEPMENTRAILESLTKEYNDKELSLKREYVAVFMLIKPLVSPDSNMKESIRKLSELKGRISLLHSGAIKRLETVSQQSATSADAAIEEKLNALNLNKTLA